jgi:pantetheine-phosphate adenylyltransferase
MLAMDNTVALRIALYSGSFDPVTNFHLEVVRRSVQLCDKLVVAIDVKPSETFLFSTEERLALVREVFEPIAKQARCGFDAMICEGPTAAAARELGATIMIHGVRDGIDLDHEMQIAGTSSMIAPEVHPVFVTTSVAVRSIAATVVREIARNGGDITSFVPPEVVTILKYRRAH